MKINTFLVLVTLFLAFAPTTGFAKEPIDFSNKNLHLGIGAGYAATSVTHHICRKGLELSEPICAISTVIVTGLAAYYLTDKFNTRDENNKHTAIGFGIGFSIGSIITFASEGR